MAVGQVGEYNPVELEERILAYWKQNKVMEETLSRHEGRKLFSFLEGPPTANAPPALHHVEVRVFKDLVNRFHYMRGYDVPRKAGWDCHGLPVEVQVEKELGLKSKKDILDYGVDKFVEKCRDSVFSHIKEWDALTERMAYWIDLGRPYVTMDNDYIESVWWSLKQLWDKKLLYEGYRVVPYCARCGTPLSSHEVAQGYKNVKETTVIVAFRAKDKDYSLLAWTTTPWTLLSNLALAVNPEVDYVTIKHHGEKYVLAKSIAETRFKDAEVIGEFKGKELVGVEYHPLFSHFIGKLEKPAWRVITGGFVTTEEGTGIVHIAPAFGEDDYNVGLENDLPLVNPIEDDGKFGEAIPELKGVFAKDADERIIQMLDDMGLLVAKYPYEHDYPFCWRCKTPLLYYAMKSWFIRVSSLTDKLLEKNNEISWYPEHIREGRFGNWVANARDWGLSRNRFWGTPLPIWKCVECGETQAIGSRKELKEKAIVDVGDDIDLHRPHVDGIVFKCGCGGEMRRVEYVIDCWYDSGSATYAQLHYPFENKKLFNEYSPYDFISEATDQTRGWFYTLLVLSAILFDKPAYRKCVVGGLLLDDNGEKMSKSNSNIIDPWELFNKTGADAVRLQMCSQAPWNARRFGAESMGEMVLPLLRTLWNCYHFTVRYMMLDDFDPRQHEITECNLELEDDWILNATNQTISNVTKNLNDNNFHTALYEINNHIVEDLSRWYIKLIRDRLWLEDKEGGINPSKKAAYMTLSKVFEKTCLMMAPLAPFITEEIYQNLLKKDVASIHHMPWPMPEEVDDGMISGMNTARKIVEAGSNCRQQAGIKLRYPIAKATIVGGEKIREAVESMREVVSKQLNAKEVEYVNEMRGVRYIASPDYSRIGPEYGGKANQVAEAIRKNPLEAKSILEGGDASDMGGFKVTADMISEVRIEVPERYKASEFKSGDHNGIVFIETERSQSLLNEALARDLIRNIQELRKKNNLEEMQRINVKASKTGDMEAMMSEFEGLVLSETRCDAIELVEGLETGHGFTYEGSKIGVEISF
ncbi:MAG: isoleucine--tRNA ligase [Candidatus Altiarchaeota archaeon]